MEELDITTGEIHHYARIMTETLAVMHWVSNINGNDFEFVLAPSTERTTRLSDFAVEAGLFGRHSMWVLDFDLCRNMTIDLDGVRQAVAAFWRNDDYYPRPGRGLSLWIAFREHYLESSAACLAMCAGHWAETRRKLPELFVDLIEREGIKRVEKEQEWE